MSSLRTDFIKLAQRAARQVLGIVQPAAKRNFDGANPSRLASNWLRSSQILDRQLRLGLTALRERSRDMVNNSSMGARLVHLNRINIIGSDGVKLQSKVGDFDNKGQLVPDKKTNSKIEDAWAKWSQKDYCTVHGKYTWHDVQGLAVSHLVSDGEFILRKRWAPAGNPFGFALQIIDPTLLDETWERFPSPGENQIRLGVEMDVDDKPVAYWFKTRTLYTDTYERTRVPASEIIHLFNPIRTGQTRGIPPLAPVLMDIKMLDAYREAEVTAATMAAAKMGFIETPTGGEYGGEPDAVTGEVTFDMAPGTVEELPVGHKWVSFDPTHPTTAFDGFTKSLKRDLSAGVNVSYHALAQDAENVTYSSLRQVTLDDRESWKYCQTQVVSGLHQPVFNAWLPAAIMKGQELKLPLSKLDKFNAPKWHGRRWSWVDPLKEVQATLLEIKAGLTTHSKVLAERGLDREEVWTELADEKQQAEALGLDLTTFAPEATTLMAAQEEGAADGETNQSGTGNGAAAKKGQ